MRLYTLIMTCLSVGRLVSRSVAASWLVGRLRIFFRRFPGSFSITAPNQLGFLIAILDNNSTRLIVPCIRPCLFKEERERIRYIITLNKD